MRRRDVLTSLAGAALAGIVPRGRARAADEHALYDIGRFGNARVLHITDTHAQLLPVYYREPSVNVGVGAMAGRPPHLVGQALLNYLHIPPPGGRLAYAFTHLDFVEAARRYGRLGGFAHLKTLVDHLRAEAGAGRSLMLDGGDLMQGSALADIMRGADMVEAANLLGVDAMTGHWEFTHGEAQLRANIARLKGDFLAQNVFLTEEAAFDNKPAFDQASGRVFKPSMIRELGEHRVGVIGQAFPHVAIAHPKRFVPDWSFGIREAELQKLVDGLRENDKVDAVLLLSHNGMDLDLKLANRVRGIDAILGGHTHDAVPSVVSVANAGGRTMVTNAGSAGKFLGVLDLDLDKGSVKGARYHLLPIFSDLLKPDAAMQALVERLRKPHTDGLGKEVAVAGDLLYRRGNFNGPMDQLVCDALRVMLDAEIAFSPGFRWGNTLMPRAPITMEDVLGETAISYPEVYVQSMTGAQIKAIMEDVCDNLFNPDPYYQQGGDMVRVGGLDYTCAPGNAMGQRISDLTLDDGRALDAGKTYRVAGWASVNPQQGKPAGELVANFLRGEKVARPKKLNRVTLKGVEGNPGVAE